MDWPRHPGLCDGQFSFAPICDTMPKSNQAFATIHRSPCTSMKSGALRDLNWPGLLLNTAYVWALGLAFAFFGRLFGLDKIDIFAPILTIIVALVTMWVGYRVALRAGRRPTLHGLVLGLMVAISGFVFSYLTAPVSSVDLAAFFLLLLGGTIGGRSAQRVLTRSAV